MAAPFEKHSIRHRRARIEEGLRCERNQLAVIFGRSAPMKGPIEEKWNWAALFVYAPNDIGYSVFDFPIICFLITHCKKKKKKV